MMDPEFSYIIKNRNTTVQKILNLGLKVSEIAFYEKPSSTFRTFHSLIIEDQWHHYANSGMHTIFCIFLNGWLINHVTSEHFLLNFEVS